MTSIYSKNDRYVAYLEIVGALTITGFWIGWFLDLFKSVSLEHALYETYVAFETSFPIADAWIVILLLVSAYGIFNEKPYGAFLAVAAYGALIFLGLIDSSFYVQQGVYQYDPSLIVINIACIVGGSFGLIWFWRYYFSPR
ncbi:MAG: hypothetical protein ACFFCW_11735 [Candidatus Hodarchaeota archaeon]